MSKTYISYTAFYKNSSLNKIMIYSSTIKNQLYFNVKSLQLQMLRKISLNYKIIVHCIKPFKVLYDKQRWATFPPISTKRTITFHIHSLNTKKTMAYDIGNPGPVLGQAQKWVHWVRKKLIAEWFRYKMLT